jgi:hypothetical protein
VYSKHLANLFLEQIEVLNPGVNVDRPALAIVASDKGFDLSKGSILHKRGDKSHTFFLRDAVSLEYEKEVELYELVFQLLASSIKGLGFGY